MAKDESLDVTVLYCSRQSAEAKLDRQFGVNVAWDIPLLEGYNHVFLKNHAPRPSMYSFWGLQNWGLIRYLWKAPKSVLVVNGWRFFIFILAILIGKISGHTVCMKIDTPIKRDLKRSEIKLTLRKILLSKVLFRFVDFFLYIGVQNKAFYRYYGVAEEKLIFSPFSVDNERFQELLPENAQEKKRIRQNLSLPLEDVIIMYSGKFMSIKRPVDVINAFMQIDTNKYNCSLVFMGDGELRKELENIIEKHKLKNVIITGFINQNTIPQYYAASDIFIMASEYESWGLSVNEAMNLGLPVIVSNEVGCAEDLVKPGVNGYIYPCGDVQRLAEKIHQLIVDKPLRHKMGKQSLQIVNQYSFQNVISHLTHLESR
ncbi:MAG: glycosyltransferase family 4 protein [Lewinellaceae bacterium]|nr:glycosyltransferase family 4 protein [Lewinellaceae bacterium]